MPTRLAARAITAGVPWRLKNPTQNAHEDEFEDI
jgi:hypothetical protein